MSEARPGFVEDTIGLDSPVMNVAVCSEASCFVNLPCRRVQPVLVVSEKMGAEDDSSEDDQYYYGEEEEEEEELGGHSYITCAGDEESVVDGAMFLMSFRANKPFLSGDSGDGVSSVCHHCGYPVFLDFSSFCCFSLLQGSHLGSSCDLQFVHIPDFVKDVGKSCFRHCWSLLSVTFGSGSSVEHIGPFAFEGTGIEEIVLPSGILSIGAWSFSLCRKLTRVMFGKCCSVQTIGICAFANTSLESFVLPQSAIVLGQRCFSGCLKLCHFYFDFCASVLSLDRPFDRKCWVTDLFIPDSVVEICDLCFSKCKRLSRVLFGRSSCLRRIGVKAFSETGIRHIQLPDSVKMLCDCCFSECDDLRVVDICETSQLELIGDDCFKSTRVKTLFIPSSVREVGKQYCCRIQTAPSSNLRRILKLDDFIVGNSITIPDSVLEIFCPASYNCYDCQNLTLGCRLEKIGGNALYSSAIRMVTVPDSVRIIGKRAFNYCNVLEDVIFGPCSCLEVICAGAFMDTMIKKIFIPCRVRELRDECFSKCESLQHVLFSPSSVLFRIGAQSFSGTGLNEICIPDSVKEICRMCFSGCKYLKTVSFSPLSCLEHIGACAFSGCDLLNFELGMHVRELFGWPFVDCPLKDIGLSVDNRYLRVDGPFVLSADLKCLYSMKSVVNCVIVPDVVVEIHDYCFFQCKNVSCVKFGPGSCLERIGSYAFSESGISELCVPNTVKEICDGCFYRSLSFMNVSFALGSHLERIGTLSFCANVIKGIRIPRTVREIGSWCFARFYQPHAEELVEDEFMDELKGVRAFTFDDFSCLELIPRKCFYRASLEMICIPSSVRILGDSCFYGCSDLKSVVFGPSSCLTGISRRAFLGTSVREIEIPRSVRALCHECLGSYSDLTLVFCRFSSLERVDNGCFQDTDNVTLQIPASVLNQISIRLFWPAHLDVLPDHDFQIDGNFLMNVSRTCVYRLIHSVAAVIVPDFVKVIDEGCFAQLKELHSVTFGPQSCLVSIGPYAFAGSALAAISIPDRVQSIHYSAFECCLELRCVKLNPCSLVDRIDDIAFKLAAIRSVFIPDSVTELGCFCFASSHLRCVTFGSCPSLKRIFSSAFRQCSQLKKIFIPDSVEEIHSECFADSGLSSITFGSCSSLVHIGIHWLRNTKVKSVDIPDRVCEICDFCFEGCNSLCRVTLRPSSHLVRIGKYAFPPGGLSEFYLPSGVKDLDGSCFASCGFHSFTVPSSNCAFVVSGPLLMSRDLLSVHSIIESVVDVTIPDTVKEIFARSFYNCHHIHYVHISDESSLERIGEQSFASSRIVQFRVPMLVSDIGGSSFGNCSLTHFSIADGNRHVVSVGPVLLLSNLEKACGLIQNVCSVVIPDSVREICDRCFIECKSLYSVTFGESTRIERLGISSFESTGIRDIVIPDSVRDIGERCFAYCQDLSRLKLSDSSCLERIGYFAFGDCRIGRFFLPKNVREVGGSLVGSAMSLLVVSPENPNFVNDRGFLMSRDLKKMYSCFGYKKYLIIPDYVTEICDRCFWNDRKIRQLGLGPCPSLERIGVDAFVGTLLWDGFFTFFPNAK